MDANEKAVWAFLRQIEEAVGRIRMRGTSFEEHHHRKPHTFVVTDLLWKLQEVQDKTLRQLIADGDVVLSELTPDQFSVFSGEE